MVKVEGKSCDIILDLVTSIRSESWLQHARCGRQQSGAGDNVFLIWFGHRHQYCEQRTGGICLNTALNSYHQQRDRGRGTFPVLKISWELHEPLDRIKELESIRWVNPKDKSLNSSFYCPHQVLVRTNAETKEEIEQNSGNWFIIPPIKIELKLGVTSSRIKAK